MKTWVGWVAAILVGQAIAFLPVESLFARNWLYSSLGFGILGLILLLLAKKRNFEYEDDGLYPHRGTEATGSQLLELLDNVERQDV